MTKVSGKKHVVFFFGLFSFLIRSPHIHLTTSWADYCGNQVKSGISIGPTEINGILVVTTVQHMN